MNYLSAILEMRVKEDGKNVCRVSVSQLKHCYTFFFFFFEKKINVSTVISQIFSNIKTSEKKSNSGPFAQV